MNKLLSLSLIGVLFSINLSANNNLDSLKNIPLNVDCLSVENGGNKSAIESYSDGVGIYVARLEGKKFTAMNELVFKHGEEAKKADETLKEYVLEKGNNKEKELASYLGPFSLIPSYVIGDSCDDNNPNTIFDKYTDTTGTCEGGPAFIIGESCDDNNELTYSDKYIDIYGSCQGTALPTCLPNERLDVDMGLCVPLITPENCANGYAGDLDGKLSSASCFCDTNITSANWAFLKEVNSLSFSCADKYVGGVFQTFTNLVDFSGLKNIEKLNNLTLIGSTAIAQATTISKFTGLEKIKQMEKLNITGNHFIKNFEGLNNLEHADDIIINPGSNNGIYHFSHFNSFLGLNNLVSVKKFRIEYARNLNSLEGLENLKTANELYFNTVNTYISASNSNIRDISALSNLEYVSNTVTLENKNYSVKLSKDSYLCNEGWPKMKGLVRTYHPTAKVYYAAPSSLTKSNVCNL